MSFGFTHSWLREDDELDRYNKPGSPDWFDLSDDVSFDKPNNRHDALKVESLLGYGGYLDLDKGGGAMGLGQRRLEDPLKAFQEKNGLKVDGLLKPGGPTITKMKQLYGKAFAGSPAPTPAMMDVQAEQIDEGKAGFIYGAAPKPLPRPNKRLDAKIELFDYERWNSDWARNATDPASFAPEYESYIRQIEPTHGHDPGLIYARDFAQKVEKRRGKGGEFVQSLLARLSDRPDLQRAFLGGEVPTHPPQGSFRPGGEAGVKDWIDQDRVANGIAPKYSKAAQEAAPVLRTSSGVAPAPQATEPDPNNLLEYVNNFGFPGTEPPDPAQGAQHPAPEYWPNGQPPTGEDGALHQQAALDAQRARDAAHGTQRPVPDHWPNGQPPTPEDWGLHQQVALDEEYARRPPQAAQPSAPPETPAPASTPGEGGAGWYDPNQMNPEGSHRRPKPDKSRGFADEFPRTSRPERERPQLNFGDVDEKALRDKIAAQPGIREEAEEKIRGLQDELGPIAERRDAKLGELLESLGADIPEQIVDEVIDAIRSGEYGGKDVKSIAQKLGRLFVKVGRGAAWAAVENSPDALKLYGTLLEEQSVRDRIEDARWDIRDADDVEAEASRELERRNGGRGR